MGSIRHTSLSLSVLEKLPVGSMTMPWPGVIAIRRLPP
jgi:hypothetical protein